MSHPEDTQTLPSDDMPKAAMAAVHDDSWGCECAMPFLWSANAEGGGDGGNGGGSWSCAAPR